VSAPGSPGDGRAAAFLRRLHRAVAERRVPVSGSLDLTARCNLRCVHCYHGAARAGDGGGELPAARWLAIVEEAAAAGCLDLLLSGGEPLLHPGFPAIYRRARERGVWVTVFTNATLLTPAIADLFAELPPQVVEISLYGADAETHERVTGVPGSFARALEGVDLLGARGVPAGLKTMILRENRDGVEGVERLARRLGLPFRLDPAVFACPEGGRRPLESRVDPGEAVALEMADPERRRRWTEEYRRGLALAPDRLLYPCGAGLTGFHVGPSGRLQACSMLPEPAHDLAAGSFRAGWEGPIRAVRELAASPAHPCAPCELRALCSLCPAFFLPETGSPERPPPYVCELARRRRDAVLGPGCGSAGETVS